MSTIQRLAISAARQAAAAINATTPDTLGVSVKSTREDLVTRADLMAEETIIGVVGATRPRDAILAEESGYRDGDSGVAWIVDPLDGTANFVRRSPHYAVSIAALCGDRCLAAVILRPADGQWLATDGGHLVGRLDEAPLPPDDRTRVAVALPYPAAELAEAHAVLDLVDRGHRVTRTGSAACDLLRVAAGLVAAHVSVALPWWDTAAGHGLVNAAGGTVVHARSHRHTRIDIAGDPTVVASLARLLAEHDCVLDPASQGPRG